MTWLMGFLISGMVYALIQPEYDEAKYEQWVLENGLRVLLVSDLKAEKSAAAITVACGHLDNPKAYPGLAHFLEHMLFLGTKQHPVVGEFQKVIQAASGYTNAFTTHEMTAYHFNVIPSAFSEALMRFSEFFKDPLLDPAYVDKERSSVDAEWRMRFDHEAVRFIAVDKQLLNQAHPYTAFDVGSWQTLSGPAPLMVKVLQQFYQQFYVANQMALVLVAPEPLAALKQKVISAFSGIPSGQKNIRQRIAIEQESAAKDVQIKSLGQDASLILSFPMINVLQSYPQAYRYLSFLIERTDAQGLFERMKPLGVGELSSYFFAYDEYQGAWVIEMKLMPGGVENKDKITAFVLAYLQAMRADVENPKLFESLKRSGQKAFDHLQKSSELHFAIDLSQQLLFQDEPLAFGELLNHTPYQLSTINRLLAQINAKSMRRYLLSPQGQYDQIEPDYQTPYRVTDLAPLAPMSIEFTPLKLNDGLFATTACQYQRNWGDQGPIPIFHQDLHEKIQPSRSWGGIYLYPQHSEGSWALWLVYQQILLDAFRKYQTDFALDHVSYDLVLDQGMTLSVTAFSRDMMQALALLVQDMTLDVGPLAFEQSRNKVMDQLASREAKPLYRQAFDRLDADLNTRPLPKVLLAQIRDMTYQKFLKAMKKQPLSASLLLAGDVCADDLVQVKNMLNNQWWQLRAVPHIPWQPKTLVGSVALSVKNDNHAWVQAYFPKSFGIKSLAEIMLLEMLLEQDYYHQMRTEKQVGYVVGVSSWSSYRNQALVFYMQSSKLTQRQMSKLHQQWIGMYFKQLTKMSREKFEALKANLIENFNRSPRHINHQAQRMLGVITSGYTDFQMRQSLSEALKRISLQDMLLAYRSLLMDEVLIRKVVH